MTDTIGGASLHLLRGYGTTGPHDRPPAFIPLPDSVEFQACSSRAELLGALAVLDPGAKAIAAVEIGPNDPTGRNLRVIESIRRSPRLSGTCRPIAVGRSSEDRLAADAAGAYAYLQLSDILSPESVVELLRRVATRVPRDLAHSRGPFIELHQTSEPIGKTEGDFDQIFRAHFNFAPGPVDLRIIRAWAFETPDKSLVDALEEDPDSGWSGSAVRRRIERLRDRAPVLYRDAAGNLAKGRLARQFPSIPPVDDTDEFAVWPDVDRCIELSSDDKLMQLTYLDDRARIALESVMARRMTESQRRGGRPPAGSRLRQLSRDLRSAYGDAFNAQFATEDDFRAAVRRALYAIADAQLDGHQAA